MTQYTVRNQDHCLDPGNFKGSHYHITGRDRPWRRDALSEYSCYKVFSEEN